MAGRVLPEGYSTWVEYERNTEKTGRTEIVLPYGGRTIVKILDEEGEVVALGVADCSERDNFSKKIGRDIATGRALKLFEQVVG